ncbi:MAG: pyridoxal phosphate-dependent aminotransferase [Patescibacteria group bacterium]
MISKRAMSITPSATLTITARAKAMKKDGIDVVSFGAGEPDFDTPDHIKKAAQDAMLAGFTKYTPTSGIPELKQAICRKLKVDNGLDYAPEQILVSTGGKQCLYNIIQVTIDPEDEVIIPQPSWVSYEEMVKLAEGKTVFVKTKDFKMSPSLFEKAITKKTRMLILNSPSNPTGAMYSKQELEEISRICVKYSILVLSDEIYEKLIYGKEHISIASLGEDIKKLTVVINGVSKTYSMTGWRIGYCAGPVEIIQAATRLQDHTTSNANSIAQKAAVAALTGTDKQFIEEIVAEYKTRRDYMVKTLNSIPGIKVSLPDGAFYVFADVSRLYKGTITDSVDFCSKLLEKKHVAVIPGSAFGDDKYIRLSYATSMEQIVKGLKRLSEFVTMG